MKWRKSISCLPHDKCIGGISLELRNIKGHTWAAEGPVNIGLYERDGQAVLIDSGNDSSSGRKILRLAEEKGWKIRLIINTHFHADHVGGNAFIQKRTGCAIAAFDPAMNSRSQWSTSS